VSTRANPLGWGTRGISGMNNSNQNTLPHGSILQARYEINKVLGVGGMGAVYLAQDLRFTGAVRYCAVKEMVIATPDPHMRRTAMQNFNREANLLVQLSHSGIPKIYDFFTEQNRTYLVMEYVDGKDLETILDNAEDQLSETLVLGWTIQICDVLTFLHSQKPPIIFRDLKPANVMLRGQNRIALIDFGIAKAFESGQKGTMIGTEGYSPPEQYQGVASPKVDIYALGATLHHLLTKRDPRLHPPFTFHEAIPTSLNTNLTPETSTVIMKALEYNANNRYPSASAFKEALSSVLTKIEDNTESPTATKVLSNVDMQKADTSSSQPPSTAAQQAPYSNPSQTGYPPQNYPGYPPQNYPGYPPPGYGYPPPGYPPMPGEEAQETQAEETVTPIWSFKCEDEVRATPSADKQNLYIGAYDNNIYALDLKTGAFQWKYATDGGIASRPYITKENIIFGSEDRSIYAVSNRGRLLWTAQTHGRIRSSAIVEFDRAFIGSDDGKIYAVAAQNGRNVWQHDAVDPVRSTPLLGDELLYVGTEGGTLLALEIRNGNVKWKYNSKSRRAFTSSPVYYKKKEILIISSFDKVIYGFNANNGFELWQTRTKGPIISTPTIYDDIMYVGGIDKHLYAINPSNGKQLWKFEVGSQVVSTPAVTDDAIYFGTTGGDVICLDKQERRIRWRFTTAGPVPSSPIVVDNVVYIGSNDYHVYALPV